jgi:threonine dehydratase
VVVLPGSSSAAKEAALRRLGAEVERAGRVWDDARDAALARAERDGLTFVHPFADAPVVAGAGTIGLEVVDDLPDVDTVLVGVGGGGLLAGVAVALRGAAAGRARDRRRADGGADAPRLARRRRDPWSSTRSGRSPARSPRAGPSRSSSTSRGALVERVVLVTDDDLRVAARWLWEELAIGAELGGSAAVAALLAGAYTPRPGRARRGRGLRRDGFSDGFST